MKIIWVIGIFCLIFKLISAQNSSDFAVMLTAEIDTVIPSITIHWNSSQNTISFNVYKKSVDANSWGAIYSVVPGNDSLFTDYNVTIGSAYEYRIVNHTDSLTYYGYIYVGIKHWSSDYKGKILILVDSIFSDTLATEIHRLMKDISCDGWMVSKHNISRFNSVDNIKFLIINEYNADSINLKSILFLGHIPVPYSGKINPDGHPDHLGAWPSDVYYGDINGVYSDEFVNYININHSENTNIPGDGKFDQNSPSSLIELQIGRIDFYDMPVFDASEIGLMKRYLDKNHKYRNKIMSTNYKALIDDNWSTNNSPIGSCGWSNFAPMFGISAIDTADFLTRLGQDSYLWSYGLGGGSYQSAGGIGQSDDFVVDTVKSVFVLLFGSYFGDWNNQNNFLKAPLASNDRALVSCWVGCPYWHFHHMVLGENIGYSTLLTQNNIDLYSTNNGGNLMHISLLGDPTLKMHIIDPPHDMQLKNINQQIKISWQNSSDSIIGYYIYRSTEEFGKYERISNIITELSYTDSPPDERLYFYMIRAIKLFCTPGGTYYNYSEGISDSITYSIVSISEIKSIKKLCINPNPASNFVSIKFVNYDPMDCIINVFDIYNHSIITQKIQLNSKLYDHTLDFSTIKSGTYLIQIKSNDEIFQRKIIIIK